MPLYPLLFALALGQNPAPGQDGLPLSVQVGLFAYRADGSTMASATTGGVLGPFDGNVFASTPCNVGSVSKEPPAGARNAWRINGQVIEVSRDSAVVQLDWQRTKQSGDPANGPTVSERLTLQSGTPVTLDSVWADATGSCDIVRIALEARLAPRPVGRGGAVGFGSSTGQRRRRRGSESRDWQRLGIRCWGGLRRRRSGHGRQPGLDLRRRALARSSAGNGRRTGCAREATLQGRLVPIHFSAAEDRHTAWHSRRRSRWCADGDDGNGWRPPAHVLHEALCRLSAGWRGW